MTFGLKQVDTIPAVMVLDERSMGLMDRRSFLRAFTITPFAFELIGLSPLTILSKSNAASLNGEPSDISRLNCIITGLRPGQLLVIAARPSMGKTFLATSIAATAVLRANRKTAYFSLELRKEKLMERLLAQESRVPLAALASGPIGLNNWQDLAESADKFLKSPLFVNDVPNLSISKIKTMCQNIKTTHGLDLIIIDYVQLTSASGRSAEIEDSAAAKLKELRQVAIDLNLPIIVLSQVSRHVELRIDKRPALKDLGPGVAENADLVMILYRRGYYTPTLPDTSLDVYVLKNQNGPRDRLKLPWNP